MKAKKPKPVKVNRKTDNMIYKSTAAPFAMPTKKKKKGKRRKS